MRINVFISASGYCSRRAAERLVASGEVKINGLIAEKNSLVEENDIVQVNDEVIRLTNDKDYIILNKPVGITCTGLRTVEANIIDFVNYPKRLFPIGRLDKDSEGLIILTNDGPIAHKILHSEHGHEKEYIVTVDHPIDEDFINGMSNGVIIGNVLTKKCKVSKIDDFTFRIILTQGLNRQIRKMAKSLGYKVVKLRRIRIMNIHLENLEIGKWRDLSDSELEQLKEQLKEEEENENFN
ncbi:23S rRNA pseudouridine synthase F [Bacillus sp. AFS002410]|uniref:pseudouridine synthase n=1 Tax=Bacillus sp. AFS002410 TaxID=2033481 RepID=UPI000BF107F1|nr:pseudouridine synthase [Bacillus sp. AFS002410]PEJ59222.1 23S rRNA pseudouridine synthase F [Bacillus sp. AFS002410]